MKTKRQTIWLVSMLSLMVILSAYYLFTEDSGPAVPKTADGQQVTATDNSGANGAAVAGNQGSDDGTVATEITDDQTAQDQADAAADPGSDNSVITDDGTTSAADNAAAADDQASGATAKDQSTAAGDKTSDQTAAKDDQKAAGSQTAKTDEEVLQAVEAQGTAGSDLVTQYQYNRDQNYAKQEDNLLQAMNDLSKTPEENAKAAEELNALQDKESKISSIEEQISQQYGNAVVTPDDNGYKVVVMNDKLEAKQAASIIDMVISELGVSQEKVKVQYISAK